MYAIYDWAGNHLHAHGEFETFEDAWCHIINNMGLDEEDFQEYYVEEL